MDIFNSKQLAQQNSQLAHLTQQVTDLTTRLQAAAAERDKLIRECRTLTQAKATAQAEAKQAQEALIAFEDSLRASLRQLGTMLEIAPSRWVDPTAIWHLSIEREEGQTWLQLNNTPVMKGRTTQEMMGAILKIIEAKAKAVQGR